ncbi:MAG: septum site-determining protein MinD [Armatimonadetes bacterium]|nr:septum site-determining protein MinD [Armatimonadota bacterium]
MGEVLVITSGKGGVGKTTATANLGVGLAAIAGKKVAMVDTDIGLRNLDVVMGLENRIVYDLVDVAEGRCRLRQALIKDKRHEGLSLLPAAQTRDKNAVNPEQMKKICGDLKREFDFVLIDCPAGIEQGFRNAVAGAEKAVVVTTPEVSAVRDADRIIGLMEAEELTDIRLIINRMRPQMVKRGDMMDMNDIQEILSVPILGVVPEDEVIVVSTNRGEPAVTGSRTHAAQAYRNITRRLLGEDVPLMPLEPDGKILHRMRRWLGIGGRQTG